MCFVASIKRHPLKSHYICEFTSSSLDVCMIVSMFASWASASSEISVSVITTVLSSLEASVLDGSVLFSSISSLTFSFSASILCLKHNQISSDVLLRTLQKSSHLNAGYPSFNWLYFSDTVILKFLPPSLMCCLLHSASSFAASAAFTISINAFSTCSENIINISHRPMVLKVWGESRKRQ